METVRSHLAQPAPVALTLWFHDAVYDPRRADNEARSADWAEQALLSAAISPEIARTVRDLIVVTRHEVEPTPGDSAFVVDIDLSILGADARRFDEYERQIRREYAWVDSATFCEARGSVLRGFL